MPSEPREPVSGKEREGLQQVMVRLTPEMYAVLRKDAEDNDRTVAATVRRAVREYLEATR